MISDTLYKYYNKYMKLNIIIELFNLFNLINFAFLTYIIFRNLPGGALEDSLWQFKVM